MHLEYLISRFVLEGYLEDGFNIKDIASLLSVSESTVYRRMGRRLRPQSLAVHRNNRR